MGLTCDAIVVGGGPAGSTCAGRLRRAGLDVTVVDAAAFPRDKVCAGWITPQVVEALRLDQQEYGAQHTFQPFTGFRVGLIDADHETTVAYDRPASFGIRRCEFDHYLLVRSGARLVLDAPVTSIRREHDGWVVNDAIRAPMLVGAGGSTCPVARLLNGEPLRGRPHVVAREAESRQSAADLASIDVAPGVPELFFCRDLQGYGWCVRKGDYLNVGLGRLDPRSLPAATARFVAFLDARHKIPAGAVWRWRGHAYAVNAGLPQRVVGDGVLLVGDAAGIADPQSGEGIRQAVESGLMAAQTIAEAGGEYSGARLQSYAAGLRARFGGDPLSDALARLVPDRVKSFLAGPLLEVPVFVKRLVIDQWFLHRRDLALGG
jgi:geranylgeranyl reductase family protein